MCLCPASGCVRAFDWFGGAMKVLLHNIALCQVHLFPHRNRVPFLFAAGVQPLRPPGSGSTCISAAAGTPDIRFGAAPEVPVCDAIVALASQHQADAQRSACRTVSCRSRCPPLALVAAARHAQCTRRRSPRRAFPAPGASAVWALRRRRFAAVDENRGNWARGAAVTLRRAPLLHAAEHSHAAKSLHRRGADLLSHASRISTGLVPFALPSAADGGIRAALQRATPLQTLALFWFSTDGKQRQINGCFSGAGIQTYVWPARDASNASICSIYVYAMAVDRFKCHHWAHYQLFQARAVVLEDIIVMNIRSALNPHKFNYCIISAHLLQGRPNASAILNHRIINLNESFCSRFTLGTSEMHICVMHLILSSEWFHWFCQPFIRIAYEYYKK